MLRIADLAGHFCRESCAVMEREPCYDLMSGLGLISVQFHLQESASSYACWSAIRFRPMASALKNRVSGLVDSMGGIEKPSATDGTTTI
jgi:hypothetical protein